MDAFMRKAWDYYARRHESLQETEVVELPMRETIPDLAHHVRKQGGKLPPSFWLVVRTSDLEDVKTWRQAARQFETVFWWHHHAVSITHFHRRP